MFGVIWKKTLAETQINVKKYLSWLEFNIR
jgi:hypothetical protein